MGDTYNCLACGRLNPLRGANYTNKYCNNRCQQDHRKRLLAEKRVEDWLAGCGVYVWKEVPAYIRDYLVDQRGHRCEQCSTETWQNAPVPLEVEHIDSDPYHNKPANLKLLCPNCRAIKNFKKGVI